MTAQPPRLALALVARFVPDSEALAGDLVEEFARRPSRPWFWWQSLSAVATAVWNGDGEVRPLRLVDQQPFDAIERTRDLHRRRRDISPSASPLPGSLGLVILGGLVTALAPIIWWGLLITTLAGLGLAALLAVAHRSALSRQPHGLSFKSEN
jgi:hypothetical protein